MSFIRVSCMMRNTCKGVNPPKLSVAVVGFGLSVVMALGSAVATANDKVKAIVNKDVILTSEYDAAISQVTKTLQADNQPIPENLSELVLRQIALKSIQKQMINAAGFTPPAEQVQQKLAEYARKKGYGSLDGLESALSQKPGEFTKLKQDIADQLSMLALQESMVGPKVNVSEAQINDFLQDPKSIGLFPVKYQVASVLVRVASQKGMAQLPAVVEQAAEALAASTQLSAKPLASLQNEQVKTLQAKPLWVTASDLPAEMIMAIDGLSVGQTSAPIASPDGVYVFKLLDKQDMSTKIISQYQTKHILVTNPKGVDSIGKGEIDKLYTRLQKGEDFGKLAKTYSKDPGSARNGGDLGWVAQGMMVAEFEAMMLQTPVGDFSTPFKTQFGWHILQVTATRQYDATDDSKKQRAYQVLFEQRYRQALEDWYSEIYRNAYIKIL